MAKVYLFFLTGSKKGKIDFSDAQVVRIGRQPHCEIQLDPHQDLPASGDHAQIIDQGGGSFMLYDSNSSWGTYMNGERLTSPAPITTGDVIVLGIDQQGNEGPRLKFYLEKDILSCSSCSGPVYKRNFRCPDCRKKVCLRCIDFQRKVCLPCGQLAPANAGYEVVMDSGVQAKAPARVVISGKDAQRVKRAQAKRKAQKKVKKKTKPMRTAPRDPGIVAERVDPGIIAEPAEAFCTVCCDFVTARTFECSSCQQPCCVMHRCGTLCPPCAGTVAVEQVDATAFRAGRGTEPELKVPDLDDLLSASQLDASRAPPQPPAHLRPGRVAPHVQRPAAHAAPSAQRPPTNPTRARPQPRRPEIQAPGTWPAGRAPRVQQPRPAAPTGQAPQVEQPRPPLPAVGQRPGSYLPPESKIRARPPTTIPCERTGCMSALDPRSFFVCDGCRKRLCPSHRAAERRCDRCRGPQQTAQPPRFVPPPARPAPIPNTMQFDPKRILGTPPAKSNPFAPDPAPGTDPFGSGYGRPAPSSGQGPPLPARPPARGPSQGDPYAAGFDPRDSSLARRSPLPSGVSSSPFANSQDSEDQDLFDTVEDEAPPVWGPQDLLQTDDAIDYQAHMPGGAGHGLGSLNFECPYCESALPAHARHCPKCNKAI